MDPQQQQQGRQRKTIEELQRDFEDGAYRIEFNTILAGSGTVGGRLPPCLPNQERWGLCNKDYYVDLMHNNPVFRGGVLDHSSSNEGSTIKRKTYFGTLPPELVGHIARFTTFQQPPTTQRERDKYIKLAKLAEQSERYDDVLQIMMLVVKARIPLNSEERTMLGSSAKNLIGTLRAQIRAFNNLAKPKTEKSNSNNNEAAPTKPFINLPSDLKTKQLQYVVSRITSDMNKIAQSMISLLESCLLPISTEPEARAFCYKLLGDHHRFICETFMYNPLRTSDDNQRSIGLQEALQASQKHYEAGLAIARDQLPSYNVMRLGLALNTSVFYYECKHMAEQACKLAREAFDESLAAIDHMPNGEPQTTILIMQMLHDNIFLWTSEGEEERS